MSDSDFHPRFLLRVETLTGGGGRFEPIVTPTTPSPPSPSPSNNGLKRIVPPLPLQQLAHPSSSTSVSSSSRPTPSLPPSSCFTPHPDGGFGTSGFVDGPLSSALFNNPTHLALQLCDVSRRVIGIFVADSGNHAIRKIDLIHRQVTTIACRKEHQPTQVTRQASASSSSSPSPSPSPSPFPILVHLHSPTGLVLDPSATGSYLLIADSGNHILRKVFLQDNAMTGVKAGKHVRYAGGGGEMQAGSTILGEANEGDDDIDESLLDEFEASAHPLSTSFPSSSSRPSTARPASSSGRPSTASSRSSHASSISSAASVAVPVASIPSASLPALSCRFSSPAGLCWDAAANLLICDRGNNKLKRLTPTGMVSELFRASGTSRDLIRMKRPQSILTNDRNQLVYTDTDSNCLKSYAPSSSSSSSSHASTTGGSGAGGEITLLAGEPRATPDFIDGPRDCGRLSAPCGIALCSSHGNGGERQSRGIFVADEYNHAIRLVHPDGTIQTLVGGEPTTASTNTISTTSGSSSSSSAAYESIEGYVNGSATHARLFHPRGLAVGMYEGQETLFIVDGGNHAIRMMRIESHATPSSSLSSPSASASFASLIPTELFPTSRLMKSNTSDHPTSEHGSSTSRSHDSSTSSPSSLVPPSNRPTSAVPKSHVSSVTHRPLTARPFTARPSSSDMAARRLAESRSTHIATSALSALAPPVDLAEWTRVDVAFWVLGVNPNFDAYSAAFHANKIDGRRLLARESTEDAFLQQLGITSKMHRKMIQREILKLKNEYGPQSEVDGEGDGDGESDVDLLDSDRSSANSSRVSSASLNRSHRPYLSRPQTASSTSNGWRGSSSSIGLIRTEEWATTGGRAASPSPSASPLSTREDDK